MTSSFTESHLYLGAPPRTTNKSETCWFLGTVRGDCEKITKYKIVPISIYLRNYTCTNDVQNTYACFCWQYCMLFAHYIQIVSFIDLFDKIYFRIVWKFAFYHESWGENALTYVPYCEFIKITFFFSRL